jgi:hypothetical protein
MAKLVIIPALLICLMCPVAPTSTQTLSPSLRPAPTGAEFYVATNGSQSGNGSISSPWDLQTALNHPSKVQPGATIYLRGGDYVGKYSSRLTGTPAAPITVRSYPGEWARVEGFVNTTLAAALPNSGGDPVTVVLTDGSAFKDSTTVWIGTEQIYLSAKKRDNKAFTNSARGWGGTSVSGHRAGDLVFDASTNLTINGRFAHYRDFEVLNSYPVRDYNFNWGPLAPGVRGTGILVGTSVGIKLINLVVHDNGVGIGASFDAFDLEAYGCLVYNNGFNDTQRGHGQGLYWQNQIGQKKIRNIISLNNFTDGMKAYAESGYAQNFLFEHVVSANNGVLESHPGNPGKLDPSHRQPNIFSGTGNSGRPINNILIHDSYLYHPRDTGPANGNLGLGYQGIRATGLEIMNSRIMGGDHAVALAHFQSGTVKGNKVYAQQSGPWVGTGAAVLVGANFEPGYFMKWDKQAYFDQTPKYQGSTPYPFIFAVNNVAQTTCEGGAALRFTYTGCRPNGGWKEITGFDSGSTYSYAPPNETEVFVIPNEYADKESRDIAHIAIYNWALSSAVSVNLSTVLSNGDAYAIYAGENYFGSPVLTGSYTGGSVSIPMTGTTVAAPIGLGWTPKTTRPEFGAFVVRRK